MKLDKKFIIPIFLAIFTISLSFSISTASAVQSTIYVNPDGSDSWSGESPTWNGTDGPKKTIKNAIGTVTTNGNIQISNGRYLEHGIIINKNVNIDGENQKSTIIDGQYSDRIFFVQTGIQVKISDLTITNGQTKDSGGAICSKGVLSANNVSFINNKAPYNYGGAIKSNYYSLYLNNCILTNNVAKSSGAIASSYTSITINNSIFNYNKATYGPGGAVLNSRGSLTVKNSKFISNSATNRFGGAFYNTKGSLSVTNSIFLYNTAPESGAIYAEDSTRTIYINQNTFIKNIANNGRGGALYHCHGTLIANNNIFTNNRATINGGAIYIDSSGLPSVSYSKMIMNNCSFTNNTASRYAGAIYNHGTLKATNCIFLTNRAIAMSGGAICNAKGNLILAYNKFTSNKSVKGGAIYSHYGKINITKNAFKGNLGKYLKYKGLYLYQAKGSVSYNKFS
ncbi:MAG: hypothetical protein Q7U35_10560 [Methanobacteriaceae archaeon]|nr:hypothetical protein [Methanobacteriaceae archaeon]MDP2835971.1 hypothetical protein [Methanobacteriaceae archaeon]MDP3484539.1 hypothetical protein [Methanobacteriaceae archaeon]